MTSVSLLPKLLDSYRKYLSLSLSLRPLFLFLTLSFSLSLSLSLPSSHFQIFLYIFLHPHCLILVHYLCPLEIRKFVLSKFLVLFYLTKRQFFAFPKNYYYPLSPILIQLLFSSFISPKHVKLCSSKLLHEILYLFCKGFSYASLFVFTIAIHYFLISLFLISFSSTLFPLSFFSPLSLSLSFSSASFFLSLSFQGFLCL